LRHPPKPFFFNPGSLLIRSRFFLHCVRRPLFLLLFCRRFPVSVRMYSYISATLKAVRDLLKAASPFCLPFTNDGSLGIRILVMRFSRLFPPPMDEKSYSVFFPGVGRVFLPSPPLFRCRPWPTLVFAAVWGRFFRPCERRTCTCFKIFPFPVQRYCSAVVQCGPVPRRPPVPVSPPSPHLFPPRITGPAWQLTVSSFICLLGYAQPMTMFLRTVMSGRVSFFRS